MSTRRSLSRRRKQRWWGLRLSEVWSRRSAVLTIESFARGLLLLFSIMLAGFGLWRLFTGLQAIEQVSNPQERIKSESELIGSLAQSFGGAFFLLGLYYTAKNLFLLREGQITDRFSKAIEHLSDMSSLPKRLGGIHALARIARDSQQDFWPTIEILTAFVRNAQPRGQESGHGPPADIQAALNTLAHAPRAYGSTERQRIDLRKADLRKADLSFANLEQARLEGARLAGANLVKARLRGAHLDGADLTDADLSQADLSDAVFYQADLRGALLRKTDLKGTSFVNANMECCALSDTILESAIFTGACLDRASLENLEMKDCVFERTSFNGTKIIDVQTVNPRNLGKQLAEKAAPDSPPEPPGSSSKS